MAIDISEKYLYWSAWPGIRLAFSNRVTGDMRAPENQQVFIRRLGFSRAQIFRPKQVHGAEVVVVESGCEPIIADADGLVTRKSGIPLVLCVLGADCLPLLLVDAESQVIGAVHAGWKGTVRGIAGTAVETMVAIGAKRNRIQVFFGPAICAGCYTIDADRAQIISKNPIIRKVVSRKNGKFRFDLILANQLILNSVGISGEKIAATGVCTACRASGYFSFRKRDLFPYGENAGVVGFL